VPSASDISDSISPGSLEYGDRQVVEDRIAQSVQNAPTPSVPGAATANAQGRLAQGPVSDLPVTDGLSVGPGAGPASKQTLEESANIDKWRIMAKNGRSPVIRKMARDALRATLSRSS